MRSAQLDRAPETPTERTTTTLDLFEQLSSKRRHFAVLGATIDIHVTREETAGAFSQIELRVPPCFPGAPAHLHEKMPESFYMLEGRIEVLKGDRWSELRPGQSIAIAPGTIHAYRNHTEEYARFLVTAPGHDRYFVELAEWMHREPVWPPTDREALRAFGRRHDTIYL
ncbi:MAG TPA: cupin domain-containing protein [Edaphobacter sp.]